MAASRRSELAPEPGALWEALLVNKMDGSRGESAETGACVVLRVIRMSRQADAGRGGGRGGLVRAVHCDDENGDPSHVQIPSPERRAEIRAGGEHLQRGLLGIVGEQVSVGMLLGYATGYSLRRIGKLVLGIVGTEIILLQYMSYRGWVSVDWRAVASDLKPSVERSTFEKIFEVLTYRLPFAASFSAGMYAGLKYNLV
ncbi:FUN14 domain-containing protein 2 [Porphyridium purpureum]|uniref:FUN14 domain-containing protein 2 n=1 Tax=Porphyridium purpureum TaxID=35688 RepID=A0A5J4YML3_PORPP|nr:FUN14 domain-containing protein 2 [Porphyridium purpureum]|eukprot:POR5611..scf295_9